MDYLINDIYGAVQGEGCQTGVPMVIVRTAGCAVGCHFCDSRDTWFTPPENEVATIEEALGTNLKFCKMSASQLNSYLRANFPTYPWVLVTGGEPAEQDLQALVSALHDGHYKVALETSGTAVGHIGAGFDWVCVSPKFGNPGGKPVLPAVLVGANEIKQVVGKQADIDTLEAALTELSFDGEICLQPMSTSKKATELCIQTVQAKGYRLSIQTHRLLDLR